MPTEAEATAPQTGFTPSGDRSGWGHQSITLGPDQAIIPTHSFVCRLSRPGDVVADPFAGRGTLPLEACIEGRVGIGNDLSPLAYLLTTAKLDTHDPRTVAERLDRLRRSWIDQRATLETDGEELGDSIQDMPPEIAYAFHPETLRELLWLRGALWRERDAIDRLLLAGLAGVLHGPTPGFLTDLMSNAHSRSRGSARAEAIRKGRIAPRRHTFRVLGRKIDRVLADRGPVVEGISLRGDARTFGSRCRVALEARGLPPLRLVVTSPPYLGVLRYGHYNWLRMWLIGADAGDVDDALDEHRPEAYAVFMSEVLTNLRPILAPDAAVAIVLGNVETVRGHPISSPSLAELVWHRSAAPAGYILVGAVPDHIVGSRKVTQIWGSRAGAASIGDTILLLATTTAGSRRAIASLRAPVAWPDRSSIQRRTRAGLAELAD